MSDAVVLVCDSDRSVRYGPVAYTDLSAEITFNGVGSGQFAAPADPGLLDALSPGATVSVARDGVWWSGGPVEGPGDMDWSPGEGVGLVTVRWATWESLVAPRLVYPQPGVAADSQTATAWTATAANAETVMRNLVNLNAGPGALAARRVPGLLLGALASVGGNVTVSSRFEALLDVLRRVASAGGGLGFRVVQDSSDLLFEVYETADRSSSVRFSRSLRNLERLTLRPESPRSTVAIVGGEGSGGTRTIVERQNTAALSEGWLRSEEWVSHSGTGATSAELAEVGDAALVEHGPSTGMSCVAVDGPHARFGVDFAVGDLVSVEVGPGAGVVDVVSSASLTSTADAGTRVVVGVGDRKRSTVRQLLMLRELERRIALLERT